MEENPSAFLSLIHLLEEKAGHLRQFDTLEPFPCSTVEAGKPAYVAIQKAAKRIAGHAGFGDLVFVISVQAESPNVAGHVELNYDSSEVFVGLSAQVCPYADAVLATLSHEVAHKFLHSNKIRNGNTQIEQEFLTDVAAVFLGMGKIMLNGCECSFTKTTNNGRSTTETTQTLRVGYLSRECFAFVYRIICEMRRVPRDRMLVGLSHEALRAVLSCEESYKNCFNSEFHDPARWNSLIERLEASAHEIQVLAAEKDLIIREALHNLGSTASRLKAAHVPVNELILNIASLKAFSGSSQLRYLQFLEATESVSDSTLRAMRLLRQACNEWRDIEAVAAAAEPRPEGSSVVIDCPIDATRLRVPLDKRRLLVSCPSCNYRFIVSTERYRLPERQTKPLTVKTRLRKMLTFVKRKFTRQRITILR